MMIPQKSLRGGRTMPGIGVGTFGSDKYNPEQISSAVREAAAMGYRLIDCAAVYGNEDEIGRILEDLFTSGYQREDFFIISKVWNDSHKPADVMYSLARTLRDLRLEYLDLYIVHWPFRNFHPRGAPPDYHNQDARPYRHEEYMETWRQMEKLQKLGLVRQLGTSNMTLLKMRQLVRDCSILPAVNEMELHPTFQQKNLFAYCSELGIQPIGYSPLGSPSRPERDRTAEDISDMEHPVIKEIAAANNLHPAQVCLKWAAQRGQIPIPFSVKPAQLKSNLQAVCGQPLSEQEMAMIAGIDCGNRLIKGQVFLWDGAKDWTDLWDGE